MVICCNEGDRTGITANLKTAPLIRVNPHVMDQHRRRENRGRIRRARPVSTDSKIQDDELRPLVEWPGPGKRTGCEGLVRLPWSSWAIDVVLNLRLGPDHAVGVPGSSGKTRRRVRLTS